MNPKILNEKKYNFIFVILILSLFVHIRFYTPLVIIRPFDLLTVFVFLFFYFKRNKNIKNLNPGYYYLLPYLIFHSFSASFISTENLLRETIQIIIILMFAFIVSEVKLKIEYKKVIFYLLIGSAVLIFTVILWHLMNNIWTFNAMKYHVHNTYDVS